MATTIERQVADAILQNDIEVEIGAKTIRVPRPTLGTMIEVSRLISECGFEEVEATAERALTDTLRMAKDSEPLADILATLMLGAKNTERSIKIFGLTILTRDVRKRLKRQILDNFTPKTIAETIAKIFSGMECGFFLTITTILNQARITKKTT
jgi:hypothetical protein